jgi:hypothetical protein
VTASVANVRVRRLDCRYVVPALEPDRAAVRLRLDRTATSALAAALGAQLESLVAGGDEGICLIRRIEIDVDLDSSAPAGQIVQRWAAAITRGLARALAERDGVVTFRDEAEHLARYFEERIGGLGAGRWYHRAFAGYDAMPPGIAVRAAVEESPETALGAFAAMSAQARQQLVEAMSESDAARAGEALAAVIERRGDTSTIAPDRMPTVEAAIAQHAGARMARIALAIVVETAAAGAPLRWEVAAATAELVVALRDADAVARARVLDAIETGALVATLARLSPAAVSALLRCDEVARAWVVAASARVAGPAVRRAGPAVGPRHTRFGGLSMLLPIVDRLGELAPVVRLAVVAKVAGAERCVAAFGDPVLRDLLGVAPRLGVRDVVEAGVPPIDESALGVDAAWLTFAELSRVDPIRDRDLSSLARRVLTGFATRLPGFAAASAEHLLRNFLGSGATVVDDESETVVIVERPPIHVILAMTSLARTRFTPSWRERPIRILEASR